jgi:ectoine hydroxylase-related dioxygenase (phytanoyl-CoA dioxygenase family)
MPDLTNAQRAAFAERGVLRLADAFPRAAAVKMVDEIWGTLADKHGILRDDPDTWAVAQPTGFQGLTRARAFNGIATETVLAAVESLLGQRDVWRDDDAWGAPLVTFPQTGVEWDVPKAQWHLDFPARGSATSLPGIRVLAFIDTVESRGGGTLVLSGSNRLVERRVAAGKNCDGQSARLRESLARSHPWLDTLWSKTSGERDRIQRFMEEGARIDDVEVRVEELPGTAGDVVLMHPWTFHAPSPNCGSAPRLMISHSLFRKPTAS